MTHNKARILTRIMQIFVTSSFIKSKAMFANEAKLGNFMQTFDE